MGKLYDIRRRISEADTTLGGTVTTSTAIETRYFELQNLNGSDMLTLNGLRLEANYKAFCKEDTDVREGDLMTPDSGTTRYEIIFVRDLLDEHIELFAKKVI